MCHSWVANNGACKSWWQLTPSWAALRAFTYLSLAASVATVLMMWVWHSSLQLNGSSCVSAVAFPLSTGLHAGEQVLHPLLPPLQACYSPRAGAVCRSHTMHQQRETRQEKHCAGAQLTLPVEKKGCVEKKGYSTSVPLLPRLQLSASVSQNPKALGGQIGWGKLCLKAVSGLQVLRSPVILIFSVISHNLVS